MRTSIFCLSLRYLLFISVASSAVVALPQSLPSTALSLPSPGSTVSPAATTSPKTICIPVTNTTLPSIPSATYSQRANDFCAQLAGEGMFGSKIVLFQDPTMEISFARSNWDESDVNGEKCAKMDGDECLKGLAALGSGCERNVDGEQVLQGISTHTTSCGTYGVKITVPNALAVGVVADGGAVARKVEQGAAVGRVAAGSGKVFRFAFVWAVVLML